MKLTPESYDDLPTRRRTLSRVLIGPAKDLRDPHLFHSLSLVAFLAWVGLGSDGFSSSCYGPEEAFLALGTHQYLAVFLALLMALTVFVISASYSKTIDSFPAGGGGYLVATKLLGTYPGLVSGCALIVDYVLTIAISIASGADAIFSFLPAEWLPAKFFVAIAVVVLMVAMNLRGVKESVLALVPVFLTFVGLHVIVVSVGEVDASLLKGQEEVDQLESQIADDMYEYCQLAADLGFHAEVRSGIGADVVMELRRLCLEVAQIFPQAVLFAGQLVFNEEVDGFFSRFLHNHTALDLLRWLQTAWFESGDSPGASRFRQLPEAASAPF